MSCIKTPRPASQSQTFRSMTRSSKQKNFSAITENASAFFNHCSRPLRRENIRLLLHSSERGCTRCVFIPEVIILGSLFTDILWSWAQNLINLCLFLFWNSFFSVLPKMPSRFKICVCFGLLITFFLDRLVSHYICATSCLDYWHLPFLLLL